MGLAGLVIGSFLNVVIDRLPRGESIVNPPSHCDVCQQRLGVVDLVPLVSYLWLRGHCRYCGARIPRRVPLVELASGSLFVLLWYRYGWGLPLAVTVLYSCILLVILVIDLEQQLILNKVIYPAIVLSLALSWLGPGLPSSLLGGISASLLLLGPALIYKGGMGGGDIKLAAFIGLVTGFPLVLVAVFLSLVGGGLLATALLVLRRKGRKEAITFGPFLAGGAVATLFWGEQLWRWYMGRF